MDIRVPTTLTDAQVAAFQALYFEEFQEKISADEAIRKAFILLNFMATILEIAASNSDFIL